MAMVRQEYTLAELQPLLTYVISHGCGVNAQVGDVQVLCG